MYAKIAAAGDDPAKIVFFYNREILFNDVSLMSNYMVKNLATKDGNSLTDEYAISGDEQDIVDVSIRSALPDLYEALTKITTAVIPAFDDCVTINAGGEGTPPKKTIGKDITNADVKVPYGDYVELYILDNNAYNANVITMVDASLYNALKYGVLKEVYSSLVNTDLYNLCNARFIQELLKLKQRLFQLKKKSVVSNLN